MPKSMMRRVIAVLALVVGLGVSGVSVASVASAQPAAAHSTSLTTVHKVQPMDWIW